MVHINYIESILYSLKYRICTKKLIFTCFNRVIVIVLPYILIIYINILNIYFK